MDQDLLTAFEQYKHELLRFLESRLSNKELAEDLLHNLFIKIDGYRTDRPIKAPRAFLYRAANNILADHFRAISRLEKKHEQAADVSADDIDNRTPEHIALQRERLNILQHAMEALPDKCKQVFRLRRFEELEKQDIAKRLGISVNMVEKHLRKALNDCQKALESHLADDD